MTNGSSVDLGSAHAAIFLDASGVRDGIRDAHKYFDNLFQNIGGQVTRFGDSIAGLGGAFTKLTAPMSLFFGTGSKVAASFEEIMKQVELFGDLSATEFEKARKFALKMGADTIFTAEDSAQALLDLLKAGMSWADAQKSMLPITDLATAGQLSLAESSRIVTGALAQYSLDASQASRVSDALAQGANASKADIADLGQALSKVGPVAQAYGLSIEDTIAVLGTFADVNILGEEAGTQLKSMLLNMARPVDDVKDALDFLGASLYDAQGNTKDFNVFIGELDAALDKLPTEKQNELMYILSGSFGVTGLNALRASGGIDKMLGKMKAAPGATDVAAASTGTWNRLIESLTGSIETLQITAITPLQESLKPLVAEATLFINKIIEWMNVNPVLANQIVMVLAALSALGPILLAVGIAISAIGTLISGLPLALFIGAVIAAGAAFQLNFGDIRKTALSVFATLKTVFNGISQLLKGDSDSITAGLKTLTDAGINTKPLEFAMEKIKEIFSDLKQVFDRVKRSVSPLFVELKKLFSTLFEKVDLSAAFELIRVFMSLTNPLGVLLNLLKLFKVDILSVFEEVVAGVTELVRGVNEGGSTFFADLQAGFNAVVNTVLSAVMPVLQNFFGFLSRAWELVAPALTLLYNWFVNEALPAIVSLLQNAVLPIFQRVFGFLGEVWAIVSPALLKLWLWFTEEGLPAILNFISDFVLPGIQSFVDILLGIWDWVSPGLLKLLDWFVNDGMPAIVGFIEREVMPIINGMLDFFKNLWTEISPSLEAFGKWFTEEGLPIISRAAENFHKVVLQPLLDLLKGLWDVVKVGLEPLGQWFNNTIPAIKNMVDNFLGSLRELINLADRAFGSLNNLGGGFKDVQNAAQGKSLGDIWNAVTGAIGMEFRDSGGPGVAGMPYVISPSAGPEVFIPSTNGTFIPNFDQVLASFGAGGGRTVQFNGPLQFGEIATPAEVRAQISMLKAELEAIEDMAESMSGG